MDMNQIKKVCSFMSSNIAVLIIIFSVAAFFYPNGFSWATNYTTLFLGAAMFGMGLLREFRGQVGLEHPCGYRGPGEEVWDVE